MLSRVEHIQDPDKWTYNLDFYEHKHNGKSFLDYTKICGRISRELFQKGVSRISDEVFLMAHLLCKDPDQVYVEHSTKLKERDMAFFEQEIRRSWEATKNAAQQ